LQELKDKDALLKQQQELLRVAQEQKVSKGLFPTAVMWNLLWTNWHWDWFFSHYSPCRLFQQWSVLIPLSFGADLFVATVSRDLVSTHPKNKKQVCLQSKPVG
jgi:hypothetical protein